MSAAAAEHEPIRSAADLNLPSNIAAIGEGLPLETIAQLAQELLEAIDEAGRTNDLAAVERTLAKWRAIREMVTDPSWSRIVEWVNSGESRRQTPISVEEFEARLRRSA